MELEELKSIWKYNDSDFQQKDEAEIALMLKGRGQSIVDKLKRSVWFELIFTVVAGIILLVYALTLPSAGPKWTLVSILLVSLVYSFYYVKKLTMLNRFNPGVENLRENLERLIDNLSGYLKFYRRSYTVLYPLYFCVVLLFAALDRGADRFLEMLVQPKTIVSLLLVAGFLFFGSTWVTNWYLRKLYGNHLDKLKGLLHDLQEMRG